MNQTDHRRTLRTDGLKHRLRYRFDNLLGRGVWAVLLWLGLVTLAVVALSALALAVFDVTFTSDQDASYIEDFWQSLLRVMDPGTMAGDVGWARRILALLVTVFGLLVAGTLIGVIAAGVEDRIERMRRGRSVVDESGHVVVLGASDRLPLLIRQLVLARADRKNSVIVTMADIDPAELQQRVRSVVGDTRGSRLVFRSGDATLLPDLELVRLQEAEAVIILSDGTSGDSQALRTVVAVELQLGEESSIPVIVELSEADAAEKVASAYGSRVHPFIASQAIGRLAAFNLREPGVAHVAVALLDDRGSDVHVVDGKRLEGMPFGEVLTAYANALPIGLLRRDGMCELNPSRGEIVTPGDRIVIVSESADEPLSPAGSSPVSSPSSDTQDRLQPGVPGGQHLLVWGWSKMGEAVIADWARLADSSSSVTVLIDSAESERVRRALPDNTGPSLEIVSPPELPGAVQRLSRSPEIDTVFFAVPESEQADSRTLLHLGAIRRALETRSGPRPRFVVEIRDVDNIPLVDAGAVDDFVISEAIASQLIAQLAEQPERRDVFLELYRPDSPSLHLLPAAQLDLTGSHSVTEIYRATASHGVLAIGWRLGGTGELVLNPSRSEEVLLRDSDQIVVIG